MSDSTCMLICKIFACAIFLTNNETMKKHRQLFERGQPQASYGKGPDYFRFKTAIFPVSVFLLLFIMKFGSELENYQYDSFK